MPLGGEQRQRRLAKRLQRPQPAAAVQPPIGGIERAQRVGGGQAFERRASEAAAPPQIARVGISRAAGRDQAESIGLGQPLDQPKPETQRHLACHSVCT